MLVLADTRLYREGLASMLRESGRLQVATRDASTQASSGSEPHADVVIVDATHDGGAAALRTAIGAVGSPVVAVGVPDDEQQIVAFAEAGVIGFVERDGSLEELVSAVEQAARGEATCPQRVTTTLLGRVAALAGHPTAPVEPSLTPRERQIVQLVADGLSNKEISQRLCIELATVKNHVHNILEKLQVNRRHEAVARLRVVQGGVVGGIRQPMAALGSEPRSRSR